MRERVASNAHSHHFDPEKDIGAEVQRDAKGRKKRGKKRAREGDNDKAQESKVVAKVMRYGGYS